MVRLAQRLMVTAGYEQWPVTLVRDDVVNDGGGNYLAILLAHAAEGFTG